jgi:hypothetical protein
MTLPLLPADAEMQSLLNFATKVLVDSIMQPAAADAAVTAQLQQHPGSPAAGGTRSAGSSRSSSPARRRHHQRSRSSPGLEIIPTQQLLLLPQQVQASSRLSTPRSSLGYGHTPAATYTGGAADAPARHAGAVQQGEERRWRDNPAFRSSTELDDQSDSDHAQQQQQQQQQLGAVDSTASGLSLLGPFAAAGSMARDGSADGRGAGSDRGGEVELQPLRTPGRVRAHHTRTNSEPGLVGPTRLQRQAPAPLLLPQQLVSAAGGGQRYSSQLSPVHSAGIRSSGGGAMLRGGNGGGGGEGAVPVVPPSSAVGLGGVPTFGSERLQLDRSTGVGAQLWSLAKERSSRRFRRVTGNAGGGAGAIASTPGARRRTSSADASGDDDSSGRDDDDDGDVDDRDGSDAERGGGAGGAPAGQQRASDAAAGLLGPSFRSRTGQSMRQLARSMRRVGGVSARLVHQQLSTHLLGTLQHQMQQQSRCGAGGAGAGAGSQATAAGKPAFMHLQALGLGAVTAEVQEGQPGARAPGGQATRVAVCALLPGITTPACRLLSLPCAGFCAPPSLTLALQRSGGHLFTMQQQRGCCGGGGGGGGSSGGSASSRMPFGVQATLHVLLSASFWLDNRSGLNLVLSDLDRRWLRGMPGPGLKCELCMPCACLRCGVLMLCSHVGCRLSLTCTLRPAAGPPPPPPPAVTADVHSPGLPRDCAALEGVNEPDLSELASAAGRAGGSGTAGGGAGVPTPGAGPDVPVEPGRRANAGGGAAADAAVLDAQAVLARLQEVGRGSQQLAGVFRQACAACDCAQPCACRPTAVASLSSPPHTNAQVRPTLLNDQSWLRFWVEEHLLLAANADDAAGGAGSAPAGGKARGQQLRARRTISFDSSRLPPRGAAQGAAAAAAAPTAGATAAALPLLSAVPASAQVQVIRSEPSIFFKISVTGSKADIKVKGSKCMAVLAATQPPPTAGAGSSSLKRSGSSTARHGQRRPGSGTAAAAAGLPPLGAAPGSASAGAGALAMYDPPVAAEVPVQRLFEFAAEVWAAPAEGLFRSTKVISIKSKWILVNDTGMVLEYKQRGTPDATHPGYASYGEGRRFAGLLQPQERCGGGAACVARVSVLPCTPGARAPPAGVAADVLLPACAPRVCVCTTTRWCRRAPGWRSTGTTYLSHASWSSGPRHPAGPGLGPSTCRTRRPTSGCGCATGARVVASMAQARLCACACLLLPRNTPPRARSAATHQTRVQTTQVDGGGDHRPLQRHRGALRQRAGHLQVAQQRTAVPHREPHQGGHADAAAAAGPAGRAGAASGRCGPWHGSSGGGGGGGRRGARGGGGRGSSGAARRGSGPGQAGGALAQVCRCGRACVAEVRMRAHAMPRMRLHMLRLLLRPPPHTHTTRTPLAQDHARGARQLGVGQPGAWREPAICLGRHHRQARGGGGRGGAGPRRAAHGGRAAQQQAQRVRV